MDERLPVWQKLNVLDGRAYRCAYCGNQVASEKGYWADYDYYLYVCPRCQMPTFFDRRNRQIPAPAYGDEVAHLPDDVGRLYREARACMSVGAYTPSVMACRKLLMNIAVQKGAAKGLKYWDYVEYLAAKGYVPPDGKAWVDHIRDKGNDANHEIPAMSQQDAEM